MKPGTIALDVILKDVAHQCKADGDQTETTIRCRINDMFDYWRKGGFTVPRSYNQGKAIVKVRQIISYL